MFALKKIKELSVDNNNNNENILLVVVKYNIINIEYYIHSKLKNHNNIINLNDLFNFEWSEKCIGLIQLWLFYFM